MTQEIIEMARDSGMELYGLGKDRARFVHHLVAFANLVAAKALAEHAMQEVQRLGQEIEQEPIAWLLTDKNINSIQVDSIQRLISRLKYAHHTDLRVRINGQDEWFQADWLKHMVRVTPPQRTWVELTDEDRNDCLVEADPCECLATPEAQELMRCVEAKSRSKNT